MPAVEVGGTVVELDGEEVGGGGFFDGGEAFVDAGGAPGGRVAAVADEGEGVAAKEALVGGR